MKTLTHMIFSGKKQKPTIEKNILTTDDLPAWVVYVVYNGIFQYYLSGVYFSIKQAKEAIKSLPTTTECRIKRYVKTNLFTCA